MLAHLEKERRQEVGRLIRQALISLNVEGFHGCNDVEGKSKRFSVWASEDFGKLGDKLPPGEQRVRFCELYSGFRRYTELGAEDRRNLVQEMLAFLVELSDPRARVRPEDVVFSQVAKTTVREAKQRTAREALTAAPAANGWQPPPPPIPPQQQHFQGGNAGASGRRAINTDVKAGAAAAPHSSVKPLPPPVADPFNDVRLEQWKREVGLATLDGNEATARGQENKPFRLARYQAQPRPLAWPMALPAAEPALAPGQMEQKSPEWLAARAKRVTASSFCNGAMLFDEGQLELWEDKLNWAKPKKPRVLEAMAWGNEHEDFALARYKELTGNTVKLLGLQVYGEPLPDAEAVPAPRPTPAPTEHVIAAAKYLLAEREVGQDGFAGALKKYDTTVLAAADDLLTAGLLRAEDEGAASGSEGTPGALELGKGWLGASPDGLLDEMGDLLGSKYYDRSIGRGVLEIKCPHKLRMGVPKNIPSYWYMPQAQGLMEILQRDWCDFYTWTPNGSVIHRVERDVRYWEALEDVLGRFWFEKVVPAREAVAAGMSQEEVRAKYQPQVGNRSDASMFLLERSKQMANQAEVVYREGRDFSAW